MATNAGLMVVTNVHHDSTQWANPKATTDYTALEREAYEEAALEPAFFRARAKATGLVSFCEHYDCPGGHHTEITAYVYEIQFDDEMSVRPSSRNDDAGFCRAACSCCGSRRLCRHNLLLHCAAVAAAPEVWPGRSVLCGGDCRARVGRNLRHNSARIMAFSFATPPSTELHRQAY